MFAASQSRSHAFVGEKRRNITVRRKFPPAQRATIAAVRICAYSGTVNAERTKMNICSAKQMPQRTITAAVQSAR